MSQRSDNSDGSGDRTFPFMLGKFSNICCSRDVNTLTARLRLIRFRRWRNGGGDSFSTVKVTRHVISGLDAGKPRPTLKG
jgi:hypothetical protein